MNKSFLPRIVCCSILLIVSAAGWAPAAQPSPKDPVPPSASNPPVNTISVPEPTTNSLILLSLGALGLALKLRKRA